jgi:hypothetical protein
MSPPSTAPTQKQLRYLRQLAGWTGQTFATPRTRAQASREIRRLRRQQPTSRAEIAAERRAVAHDMAERRGDDARVRADAEVAGFGSEATWSAPSREEAGPRVVAAMPRQRAAAARERTASRNKATDADAVVSRQGAAHMFAGYRIGDERRLIVVQRIRGAIRVGDLPANGKGERYLLADELQRCGELDALLHDYAAQAAILGVIPASPDGVRGALERLTHRPPA